MPAGDESDTPLQPRIEWIHVASVNRVMHDFSAEPEKAKATIAWLTTKAGTIEERSQQQGQPPQTTYIENPTRQLAIWLTEGQARELRDLLSETIDQWDNP